MLSSRPAPALQAPETGASDFLLSRLALGALLVLLLVAPYELSGFWPGDYDFWPQTLFLLLGAGGALALSLCPAAMPRFDATARLLLAFLGWCALSTALGVYRHDSLLELARVGGAALIFFALRAVWTPRRAWLLIAAWCIGVCWLAIPTTLEFLQTRVTRQFGPYSNENVFANALAMTLPIALVAPLVLWRRFRSGRVGGAIGVAGALPFFIGAAGLLVTASKGGFLAGALGVFTTAILVWRARRSQLSALLRGHRALFGVGAALLLLLLGVALQKTILPRLQQARSGDNSTVYRTFLWRSTLDMALDKPLTGWGTGDWRHVYLKFARVSYTRHAHQSWLQIASENGWPALGLLLGAVVCALGSGLKRLQSENWPLIAGAAGAVVAMMVHGSVDSGFLTTSVSVLFFAALALLTAHDGAPPVQFSSRLNPFWLGATLFLAWGGWQSQKAASGQSESQIAAQFLGNGAPDVALQHATTATQLDEGAASLWLSLGGWQERSGSDGRAALQTAAQLQPTLAANWANLARAAERHGQGPQQVEGSYARALEWAPVDTQYLLERAEFRLATKNSAGYADLETVLALWDAPYGKYPPIELLVNLDFARATLLLSPELKRRGQTARRQTLLQRALTDCARAKSVEAANQQLLQAAGSADQNRNADLEPLTAQLQALQSAT